MEYPLIPRIEDISSKMIGDHRYHGKPVVLLEDAVAALELLESQLWAIYKQELDKASAVLREASELLN